LDLVAFSGSGLAYSGTLAYEIYDIFNQKILAGEKPLLIAASGRTTQTFSVPARRGIFRILAWVKDEPRTMEEVTYAVLPRPRTQAVDETSLFGVHPNLMPFELAMHQRMGIKWARAMSPETIFRWSAIEPVEGQITWYDEKVDRAPAYGMNMMGTIGTNNYWPSWADKNGMPDLDKWESFVERLVTHYKGRVKYWEVWNEPIYVFTPEFYAQLLKRAAAAIRRADPSAKIVGMGGVYDKEWIIKVMNLLGENYRDHLDHISTHLYPPSTDPSGGETESRAMAFKRDVIDVYRVEVWNTETGVWDEGFYKGENSNFSPIGEAIWPHFDSERYVRGSFYESERLIANLVHCIGNGLTKYFYYDSRIYVDPSYQKSHPTMLEYDDSIRAKGITYAIAAAFLDGSIGMGSVSNNSNIYAYLFDRGGKPTVVIWSKDKLNYSLQLGIPGFKAYDIMGNELSNLGTAIQFGRTPVFISSDTISTETFKNAFHSAVISAGTDAIPPALSIDEFPTGPVVANSMMVRWLGIDDTSIPSASDPSAVLYSFKLEGADAHWSAWTPRQYMEYKNLRTGRYISKLWRRTPRAI
jgi:hypothetical protein